MTTDGERHARAGLSRIVEPGSWQVHTAVRRDGAEAVWEALRHGRGVAGCSPALVAGAATRAEGHDPARDLDRLAAAGGRLLCPGDDEWPRQRLTWATGEVDAPPLALHVVGPHRLDEAVERSVAVVGARAATAYGEHVAADLAGGLVDRAVTVVSGGAYGIDAAAHRGALAVGGAPTVAVLACGVDVVYPRGNTTLLRRVAAEGLVISELPPGCAPTRVRFLVRNRVIAALSLGTVVVEAARRSGSLSTLGRARRLGRRAMVVPGPVTSALSAGCHERLRDEVPAACVTCVEDVLEQVGRVGEDGVAPRRGPVSPRDELAETARRVLDAVPVRRSAGPASIAKAAGVAPLVVQQVLPALLVHGLVERTDEGYRLTGLGAGRPAGRR